LKNSEYRLRRFLEYTGGRLNKEKVRSFLLSLKDYSAKTRLHYYQTIKQFLEYLNLGVLMNGLKRPKVPRKSPPVITVKDVVEVLGKLRWREGAEVLLLAYTGLRPWEAHRLKWDDLDLKKCMVRVRAEVAKDREERYTFFPRSFSEELFKVKEKAYKPLDLHTLQHRMKEAGCRLTPKLLRKFFIQRLEKLGVPKSVVKKLSGHRLGEDVYDRSYFNASWSEVEEFYRRVEEKIIPGWKVYLRKCSLS